MRPPRRWMKTDPGLRDHPAFIDLVAELGSSPVMVDGLLHGLWATAYRVAEDGDLTRFTPRALARAAGWPGHGEQFVKALVDAGFLFYEGDRLLIHDWYDWGGALFVQQGRELTRQHKHRNVPFSETGVTVTNGDVTVTKRDPRAKNENKNKNKNRDKVKNIPSNVPSEEFMSWWKASTRKGSRADAIILHRYWRLHGASAEDLLMAVTNYIAYCTSNERAIKDGSTFLARSVNRWQEWVSPEAKPNGNGKKKRDTYQEVIDQDKGTLAWFYSDDHTRVPSA